MGKFLTNVTKSEVCTPARHREITGAAAKESGIVVYYRDFARDRWGGRDDSMGALFRGTDTYEDLTEFWRAYRRLWQDRYGVPGG